MRAQVRRRKEPGLAFSRTASIVMFFAIIRLNRTEKEAALLDTDNAPPRPGWEVGAKWRLPARRGTGGRIRSSDRRRAWRWTGCAGARTWTLREKGQGAVSYLENSDPECTSGIICTPPPTKRAFVPQGIARAFHVHEVCSQDQSATPAAEAKRGSSLQNNRGQWCAGSALAVLKSVFLGLENWCTNGADGEFLVLARERKGG